MYNASHTIWCEVFNVCSKDGFHLLRKTKQKSDENDHILEKIQEFVKAVLDTFVL